MPTKKAETALAIHRTASLAATAWQKLEAAAQKTMNGNALAPALQLFADANGITALVSDKHGARVLLQGGKVSVTVPGAEEVE
jgi:hypothetical protein